MTDGFDLDPATRIIGHSPAIRSLLLLMEKVADTDTTVVLTGESGTGKGMVARALHAKSSRRRRPFVSINCGAIPENLLESALFGHVRGAFTGATDTRTGKFAQADGGTLFLDEIGDMSPALQAKILKAIEEREIEPVGGSRSTRVDVRIIAATHKDLRAEVETGRFRHDLFYRIFVVPIVIPPLRERPQDIEALTDHFLDFFNIRHRRSVTGIDPEARRLLAAHGWPGNVRELRNAMERIVVLKDGGTITAADLPEHLRPAPAHPLRSGAGIAADAQSVIRPEVRLTDDGICLNTAVTEYEKALILQTLEKTRWVKNRAAKLLHLNRTTLVEKIKRYHLENTISESRVSRG